MIGAIYAANSDPVPAFEARVRGHLARGLVRPAIRKVFTTTEGLRALYCLALLVPTNLFLSAVSLAGDLLSRILPPSQRRRWRPEKLHAPFRRFASRTTILRRVFEDDVFEGRRLRDLPANTPLPIVNAADLRTGSAFYFSQQSSGSCGSESWQTRMSRLPTRLSLRPPIRRSCRPSMKSCRSTKRTEFAVRNA
ncbi:hypothetical protein V8352_21040 [Roseovarius sp. D0-M9]